MRVTVKLYGTVRRLSQPDTPGGWQGDIPEGYRVSDLIVFLGSSLSEVNGAAINGEVCALDATIPEGAEVLLVTPMGAG